MDDHNKTSRAVVHLRHVASVSQLDCTRSESDDICDYPQLNKVFVNLLRVSFAGTGDHDLPLFSISRVYKYIPSVSLKATTPCIIIP